MAASLEAPQGFDVPSAASEWALELLENIRRNFRMQGIYPYTDRNLWYAPKDDDGLFQWRSTGAAFDNLHATVMAASENRAQIDLFYQKYLDFVDLGVGYFRKAHAVNRTDDYTHFQRYAKQWDRKTGDTHRPVVQIELYNTRKRMLNYFRRYYLYQAPIYIMRQAGFDFNQDAGQMALQNYSGNGLTLF